MKNNLTINITTYPQSNFENDLKIIKSAILYGDNLNFYNPIASIIITLKSVSNLSLEEKIFLTAELLKNLKNKDSQISDQLIQTYSFLKSKKNKNRQEIQTLIGLENTINKLMENINSIVNKKDYDELDKAINSGVLKLKGFSFEDLGGKDMGDYVVERYKENLKLILSDGNNYPLFDEGISSIIEAAINEGVINPTSRNIITGKRAGLASGIILALPNFERATISEIIDIRKELEKPLISFRSTIMDIAEKIKKEQWSEDFIYEVEDIVNLKVKPAINEIEEKIKNNNYLKRLVVAAIKDMDLISMIGLGLTAVGPIIDISKAYFFALGGLGLHAINQLIKKTETSKEIRSNSFYFVYYVKEKVK